MDSNFYRLFLIDTYVIYYQIVHILEGLNLSVSEFEQYLIASGEWIQQVGYLPPMANQNTLTIWLEDSKPYWRLNYYTDYKANRKTKPKVFEETRNWFNFNPLPKLIVPSYEADDLAALYTKLWTQSTGNILQLWLVTIDSDWQGLVNSPGSFWYDSKGYEPRLRTKKEVYNWLCSKHKKQSKRLKSLWELPPYNKFCTEHIWQWKSAVGDKSDNLESGASESVIDLFNPPEPYRLWNNERVVNLAKQKIEEAAAWTPGFSISECEKIFRSLGVQPPITPYTPDLNKLITLRFYAS